MKQRSVSRKHHPGLSITWHEPLGLPECPYVIRWKLELRSGRSLRLHHWLKADDDRAYHDHPWWFLTIMLRGGYIDDSPAGQDVLYPGSVRFRRARHQHTVRPYACGAWTLMVTGPKSRSWGFWKDGKFFRHNKWFFRFGHHPCS